MPRMIFKDILLIDPEKELARYVQFQQGINVITSSDNHVGKSLLLKSLYYSLGAEVNFGAGWESKNKICAVSFLVDDADYSVVRYNKRFIVYAGDKLIGLCRNVMSELSPLLQEIFNLPIYLPNKKTGLIELAPPAFMFLPYYIDQDKGWVAEPFDSFESLTQYRKDVRHKALLYHLGVYTKKTIDIDHDVDLLQLEINKLQLSIDRAQIALDEIEPQLQHLALATTSDELEQKLEAPRKRLADIIKQLVKIRGEIQILESELLQHEQHLRIVTHVPKQKKESIDQDSDGVNVCPNCGFDFDDAIYTFVRRHYSAQSTEYVEQQIRLIIASAQNELKRLRGKYISLMTTLREEENIINQEQDSYETYVKQRGLSSTVEDLYQRIGEQSSQKSTKTTKRNALKATIKDIRKRQLEAEEKYADYTRHNIVRLGAWVPEYEGQIKLLHPLKGQGTISTKTILSQYVSFFSTMSAIDSKIIRFPFVVDSPKNKEPSAASSKDILDLITGLNSIPQTIMATVDFENFDVDRKDEALVIHLTEQRKLLNAKDYQEQLEAIERYIHTFNEWD